MAVLRVPVSPSDHISGAEYAPVTLVEYGDYQCPYCAEAFPIVEMVRKHFGDA
jgi:protein-disulfide isomerase